MDDQLRRVERRALAGDAEAERLWRRLCGRMGLYFRDHQPNEILTEWEEIQEDYDETFWHAKGPKHFSWSSGCWCCFDVSKWAVKLMQDHHDWGHKGWNNRNSKRKTLRTHRDGSKSRNHRLPKTRRKVKKPESAHERRRKKRFGGRERLYGREWKWNPQTQRYKIVVWCRVPGLDA